MKRAAITLCVITADSLRYRIYAGFYTSIKAGLVMYSGQQITFTEDDRLIFAIRA